VCLLVCIVAFVSVLLFEILLVFRPALCNLIDRFIFVTIPLIPLVIFLHFSGAQLSPPLSLTGLSFVVIIILLVVLLLLVLLVHSISLWFATIRISHFVSVHLGSFFIAALSVTAVAALSCERYIAIEETSLLAAIAATTTSATQHRVFSPIRLLFTPIRLILFLLTTVLLLLFLLTRTYTQRSPSVPSVMSCMILSSQTCIARRFPEVHQSCII